MDAKTYAIFKNVSSGGGGGGSSDHTQLTNRDAENQHPISAISGLQDALDGKATEAYVNNHHDTTKQDALTAGENISIVNNVISATGGGGGSSFELINHVTVGNSDVVFVDVDRDSNNNSFSLKEIIVIAKTLSNSGGFGGWIRLYPNNVAAAGCEFGSGITNENEYSYQTLHAKVIGGTYIPLSHGGSINSSNQKDALALAAGSGKMMTQTAVINAMQSITSIRMTSYQASIGAGSEIWLYGVRV